MHTPWRPHDWLLIRMSKDFHSLQICLQFSPKTCKILLSGQISFAIINNSGNNHTKSWQQPCNVMATSIRSHDTNNTKSWQQLCTVMVTMTIWMRFVWQTVIGESLPQKYPNVSDFFDLHDNFCTLGCVHGFLCNFCFWPSTSIQLSICGVMITMTRFPWNISSLYRVDIKS